MFPTKSMCKRPCDGNHPSRCWRLKGGELVSGVKPVKKVREGEARKTGEPDHAGLCGAWQAGQGRAAVLTISHMDWAGMQESQCTRDSVDCGKVLGTL